MNHNHQMDSNANMKWDNEAPQNPPAFTLLSIPPVLTWPTNFNKPHKPVSLTGTLTVLLLCCQYNVLDKCPAHRRATDKHRQFLP